MTNRLFTTESVLKKNNYLINLLLKLEKEDRSTNASFAQSPEDYHQSIETYISKNANDLEAFLKTNPNSDLFKKVALSSIKYHYFTRKELYPFRHFGVNSFSNFKKLPSSFYNFRKEI